MESLKPEQTTNPTHKPTLTSLPTSPEPNTKPHLTPTSISSPKPETNDEEPSNIKDKFCPKYTTFEIIKKSTLFSLQNWRSLIFNQIKTMTTLTITLYLPIYRKRIIDSITTQKDYNTLFSSVTTFLFLSFIKMLIQDSFDIIAYLFVNESIQKYNNLLLHNVSEKDIAFFEVYKTGELVERLEKSKQYINKNLITHTCSFIQAIIQCLIVGSYLFKFSKTLLCIYIVIFIFRFKSDDYIHKYIANTTNKQFHRHVARFHNAINEFVSNIRLIKSFAKEQNEIHKITQSSIKVQQPYNVLKKDLLQRCVNYINDSGEILIMFIAGVNTLNGTMSYGDLAVLQAYSKEFRGSLRKISSLFFEYRTIIYNWSLFFEVFDFKSFITSLNNIKQSTDDIKGEITFDNVSFAYPLKPTVPVIKNMNVIIPKEKTVAIVGHSGSGKTTISSLIQRFYDPYEGTIFLDGVNIKDFNVHWLREQIGIVSQEPVLCTGSIRDNFVFGAKEGYTEEFFKDICRITNVSKFVEDKALFPEGYETKVGERGSTLSGGQKQRIAIARALMRESKILILDEATSALDAESENDVQIAIEQIIKERKVTTIIIAHRLSTIKNADVILVVNGGKICEQGSHKELIEKDGEYKKLVQKQLVEK